MSDRLNLPSGFPMQSSPMGGGKGRSQGGCEPVLADRMYIRAVSGRVHRHQYIIEARGTPPKAARTAAHVRRQLCQANPASPAHEARRDQLYCRASAESKKGVGECCRPAHRKVAQTEDKSSMVRELREVLSGVCFFIPKGDVCTIWSIAVGQGGGFSHTQAEGEGQDRKGKNLPVRGAGTGRSKCEEGRRVHPSTYWKAM